MIDARSRTGRFNGYRVAMSPSIPVGKLFETHLTVRDLQRSIAFYRDVVGLPLATEVPERNLAFMWIGDRGTSMLGLWGIGSAPLAMELHTAFEVTLDDLLESPARLREHGVTPLSFVDRETDEPDVLCWMPAASIYFRDPDGHLLEYITMLDDDPDPDGGVVSLSDWRSR